MSQTLSIFCMDCRKRLLIGQTHGSPEFFLYRGDDLVVLQAFINNHLGHSLMCQDDEEFDESGFEDYR